MIISIRGAIGDFTRRCAVGRYWGGRAKTACNWNIFHIFCNIKRFRIIELTLNIRISASPSYSQRFSMSLSLKVKIHWTRLTPPLFRPLAKEDNFPVTSVRWFVGISTFSSDTKEPVMKPRHRQRVRHAATTVKKSLDLLQHAKITWPSVNSLRYVTFQRFGWSFHL